MVAKNIPGGGRLMAASRASTTDAARPSSEVHVNSHAIPSDGFCVWVKRLKFRYDKKGNQKKRLIRFFSFQLSQHSPRRGIHEDHHCGNQHRECRETEGRKHRNCAMQDKRV